MTDHDPLAGPHTFEVVQDWHRPPNDPSEWRISRCACGQYEHEGRAPTGLPETRPEL